MRERWAGSQAVSKLPCVTSRPVHPVPFSLAQASWLDDDLSTVDRARTPWLVVFRCAAARVQMLESPLAVCMRPPRSPSYAHNLKCPPSSFFSAATLPQPRERRPLG